MSNPVMFKDLPATFPEENKRKMPAAAGSLAIHVAFLVVLILVPLLMPQRIDHWQLMTLIAPLAPPPPPAPVPLSNPAKPALPEVQPVIHVEPGAMIMPTEIPKEIARLVEGPALPVAGVPGGVPGGVASGLLQTLLAASVKADEPAPPSPPPLTPPPPAAPVITPVVPIRVGGAVKEPKVAKVVPPVYPKLAAKARITGTVILEAVLTAEGTVDEIQVVSGHPLLVQAAIDCVKQWRYEPTYLNGEPVPVVLNAKVHFELGHL